MAVGPPPPASRQSDVVRDSAYYRALAEELDTMIDRMAFIVGEIRNLSHTMESYGK